MPVVTTDRPVEQLIKGMPNSQQGRARTLYERGKQDGMKDAVIALQVMLTEDPDPAHTMLIINAWADTCQEQPE